MSRHLHPRSTSRDIAQWSRERDTLGHYAGLRDGDLVKPPKPSGWWIAPAVIAGAWAWITLLIWLDPIKWLLP